MEKEKRTEKRSKSSVRSKLKRTMALVLSILMVISVIDYSGFIVIAQTPSVVKTITAIEGMAENVSSQQIAVGASETDINLPDALNVTVKSNESETVTQEVIEDTTLEKVTWKLNASMSTSDTFDSTNAGDVFHYEPVLPEGYIAAEGISLPQIKVEITESEQGSKGAFHESKTIDGIEITVKADAGVFPEGAILSVEKVIDANEQEKIEEAISEEVKAEDAAKTVTELVSFDITITNANGNELQPDTSKGEVRVSFAQLPMVTKDSTPAQELKVFHLDDSLNEAQGLDTTVDQETGTLEASAEHFSTYTVAALTAGAEGDEASVTDSEGAVTTYGTLEAAITAAQGMKDSTITLLKDVDTEAFITVSSGMFTIDLNGKTWKYTRADYKNQAILLNESANVTFEDSGHSGKMTTTSEWPSYIVFIDRSATVIFKGGTYEGGKVASIITYGRIVDRLAEGYAYKNINGTWSSDVNGYQISNVTVQEAPLKITAQPEDVAAYSEALVLSVTAVTVPADSGKDITYQWYSVGTGSGGEDVAISNATNASYAFPTDSPAGTYTYYCAVTCDGYTVKTQNATVEYIPINITTQPEDAVAFLGYTEAEAPTLRVTAKTVPAGSGKTITYQWYRLKSGNEISDKKVGTDSNSYTIPTGLAKGTNTYYCAVTCDGYTVNTQNMVFTVYDKGTGDFSVTTSNNITIYFTTLEEAITAAKSMYGSTVKLLADATTANMVVVASGTFTIDLHGKTWTSTANSTEGGLVILRRTNITLKDSASGGKFTGEKDILINVGTSNLIPGSFTIESGTYENKNGGIALRASSAVKTVSIKGGTFTNKAEGAVYGSSAVVFDDVVDMGASLTGGTYDSISFGSGSVRTLLETGYGYKSVSGDTWVNDLSGNSIENVTVQPVPAKITAQPQDASTTETYGYTSAPTLSVTAETTAVANGDISYQWYRVKSESETSYTAVGTNSNTLTIPTGLDAGTHSFYCAVSCDGYIVNTQSVEFTVNKATPTFLLGNIQVTERYDLYFGDTAELAVVVYGVGEEMPTGTITLKKDDQTISSDTLKQAATSYGSLRFPDLTVGEHTITVEYTPSSTDKGKNYTNAKSNTITFQVAKADQSPLSITEVSGKKYGDADFTVETTGGSGTGEVTYSVPENNGVLSISGSTATITGAGTVTVTAVKAADNNYNSTSTTREITIAKAPTPTITFPTAGGITYGQKQSESTLSGGSTEYGTFAWEGGDLVPVVFSGTNHANAIFTPNADTIKNFETITNTKQDTSFVVTKATPTVTVNTMVSGNSGNRTATLSVMVSPVGYGNDTTGTLKLIDCTNNSEVDITGATAVTMTGGKATYTWTGLADKIYKVKVVYSGDICYNTTTSAEYEVDTAKKNQTALNIVNIGTKTYGDSAFALTTTGGSGSGVVTFTSSDSNIVSISGNMATIHKAGIVTLIATKATDNNYLAATTSVLLSVGKRALTVRAEDKQNIIAGSSIPQLTYNVTGLIGSDTFTGPNIFIAAPDTNTLGEHEIKISGGTLTNAGNYAVTYTNGRLTIVKASMEPAVLSGITDQNYTGNSLEQSGLSVQVNAKTLTKDTDYTLAYKNNTQIGTATVTVTGKGIYTGTIEKNFQINVSNGAAYTISNMEYKVTNPETNGEGSVTLVKSTKSKSQLKGTLKIGDTVTIGGQSFKITAIDAKAFKGYTKLTKVTIEKNVTTIGKEAFSGCSKVSSVTIGTGLNTISANAFYNCKKLKTITINSKQLKTVGKNAIKNTYGSAVIKVPSSKVSAYKKLFKSKTGFTEDKQIKKK